MLYKSIKTKYIVVVVVVVTMNFVVWMPKREPKSNIDDDPNWVYCTRLNDNRMHLKYNCCGLKRQGRVNWMKHHFTSDYNNIAPCLNVLRMWEKVFLST